MKRIIVILLLGVLAANAGNNGPYPSGGGSGLIINNTGITNLNSATNISLVRWVTTTTNIGGIVGTSGGTPANSAMSFTLQGSPSVPVSYYLIGHIHGQTASATAGLQSYLDAINVGDIWSGYYERPNGASGDITTGNGQIRWRAPFAGHLMQFYGAAGTTGASCDFQLYVTMTATNQYNFQLYQVSTGDPSNLPFITTNSYIRIERLNQ